MTDNNCPHCGMSPGNCYAICPSQGLAEWERHHEQHVAPFSRDHLTEGRGDPDPYEGRDYAADFNGSEIAAYNNDPATDIFDGRATGYSLTAAGHYPLHPGEQIRSIVIARQPVPIAMRRWVELWAYGKPTPELCDEVVAQVQLDTDDIPF